MRHRIIRSGAQTFTRISKHAARRLWGKKHLAFCPVKLRPGYPFSPHCNYPAGCDKRDGLDISFEGTVSMFEYCNCTGNETGTYTAFYTVKNS